MVGTTTIQVSDELRIRLKILSALLNTTYEDLLKKLADIYETEIPFRNEEAFAIWFEQNLEIFGFKKIVEKNTRNVDYVIENFDGKKFNVELELIAENFIRHEHEGKIDFIVAAYASKNEINGIPVISAKISGSEIYQKVSGQKRMFVVIPEDLWEKLWEKSYRKFKRYGALKRGVIEAIEKWVREN